MIKLLTIAAATGLVVCQGAANAADIEFWYGSGGSTEEAIQDHCNAFNETQSEHTITCVGQGGYEGAIQNAIDAYETDAHPVMVQSFEVGTLELMLSGAVIPVSDILPDIDWSNYISGARSYYETLTGKMLVLPYNGTTIVFLANMEQLGDVGVTDIPETWEAIIDAARKLKDNGHLCPFVTDAKSWRVLEQFAARHGVPIATRHNGYEGFDAEYVMNTGLLAEHLNNLVSWREEGLVRLAQDTQAGRYNRAFYAGECAMMEAPTSNYEKAVHALGEDVVAMSLAPNYEGVDRHNTFIGGASIAVMKGHSDEDLQGARAFLNFVRDEDQQIAFTNWTGNVPLTLSALDKIAGAECREERMCTAAVLGAVSLGQPTNEASSGIRLGFFAEFRKVFEEETQRAFAGEQTMQGALDNAVRRGNEFLRSFEKTHQGVDLP